MINKILTISCSLFICQFTWGQRQLGAKFGVGLSEIVHTKPPFTESSKITPGFSGQFGLAYRANPGKVSSLFLEITVNQLESKSEYSWPAYSGTNSQVAAYYKDTYRDHYTSVMASFYYGIRIDKVCLTVGTWLAKGIRYTTSYTHDYSDANGTFISRGSLYTNETNSDIWMGARTGVIYALTDRYFIETHYLIGNKSISSSSSTGSVNDVSHQLIISFRYNFVVADPAEPRERKRPQPGSRRRRARE